MVETTCEKRSDIWNPSDDLSPRVKKLRQEYFSFNKRDFRNEVMAFTTGEPGDVLFSSIQWGVAPEVFIFAKGIQDTLTATATKVEMPEGFWKKSIAGRKAEFFAQVIKKHLPVRILDGELIVGAQFNTALSKALTPVEAKEWRRREKKWYRKNLKMIAFGLGNCGAIPGHLIPDYPTIIQIGMKGLVEKYRSYLEEADGNKRQYIEALITTLEAVPEFTGRYAELAMKLADKEDDPERVEELLEIARICKRVPWEPASTFHEALQSLWFTHMMVMAAESYPGPGLSPGRVDQYLYPYYKADLKEGRLTREKAFELLSCWFIKHNYAYDFMGRVGTTQGINSGFGQLITLGGCGQDEKDASNDLTMLLLDVIDAMNMLEPKPNVRLHPSTSAPVMEKVVDMVGKAQGSPFLLNFDGISMRALKNAGLPEEDLWDYAPVGCLENTLQGNDRSGTVDVNPNLAKPVELVFTRGRDMRLKLRVGPRTADPKSMKSYEEFEKAYLEQLGALMDKIVELSNEADAIRSEFEPTPYLSALVRGCAENGKDVTAGGCEHNFITIEGVAFATAVDSLAAVKQLVFEEKKISMAELTDAIKSNFRGHEKNRQMLVNRAPKYGNDDPRADEVARSVNKFFSEKAAEMVSPATGRRYRSGYLSWNYWVMFATSTSATPDGRLRGTYLSNGVCPVTGRDREGPVANARSVYNMDLSFAPNGGSHTISFNPVMATTDKGRENLKAFLRAYGVQGGSALQINMIDPDTLRRAQKNPSEYSNLLVRVTGYNAYFTALGREIQEEIISRESHRLGE